ncbi:MAG TPA: GYD domain-containing protein [Candidatus Polarisedimenticolaceae bacterium]|nr:GYD domain-containing protein [Candidatus Polarisedimenticolaceae bacterium]
MPKYVSFFTYTPEAWRAMTENPQDRSSAARTLVEGVGGRLESFYWMSGKHDGLLIADLPDDQAAAALAAVVKGAGAVKEYETHALTTTDHAPALLKKAQTVAKTYRAPGR